MFLISIIKNIRIILFQIEINNLKKLKSYPDRKRKRDINFIL